MIDQKYTEKGEDIKLEKSVEDMVPNMFYKYVSFGFQKGVRVFTFVKAMGSCDQNQIRFPAEEIKSISIATKEAGGSR